MTNGAAKSLTRSAVSLPCFAQEVTWQDAGTYEWQNEEGAATGVFIKFSLSQSGVWSTEGKLPGKEWAGINCDTDCNYRNSSQAEVVGFFPREWVMAANISCIQNIAQAFCRASGKARPDVVQHLILTLVTGKPVPVILKRIE